MTRSTARGWLVYGVALAALLSCRQRGDVNAMCAADGDCQSGLLCSNQRCRQGCQNHGQCFGGEVCAPTQTIGRRACVRLDEEAACAEVADCPAPLTCGYGGLCRTPCASTGRCPSDMGICNFREGTCEVAARVRVQVPVVPDAGGDAGDAAADASGDAAGDAAGDVSGDTAGDASGDASADSGADAASDGSSDSATDAPNDGG